MKKTKVAAVLLAASMTAGLLAGCGGTETASFPDPEKTITMIVLRPPEAERICRPDSWWRP